MRDRVILAAALLLAACGGPGPSAPTVPLFDLEHAADVLVEAGELEPPPSKSGNRFLKGWWPRPTERGFRLIPNPLGVSIEIAQLTPRVREVRFGLEFEPELAGAPARVRIGEREPVDVPLATDWRFTLPADLPLGRVPIEIAFPEGSDVHLSGSNLGEPATPGRVDLGRESIRQAGTSRIELTRYVRAGTLFEGAFEPPQAVQIGQAFTLSVEISPGERRGKTTREAHEVMTWHADTHEDDAITFSHIFDHTGPARFVLAATGEGPPATWTGLRLTAVTSGAIETSTAISKATSTGEATGSSDGDSDGNSGLRLVMVYILDALRADALGTLSGDPEVSPFLDRLAREGVLFTDHQSVAPNTLPSTKAFFTGRTPMLQGHWKLADGAPTLAESFRDVGFRTAAFSGNGFLAEAYGTDRGFELVDPAALFEDYAAEPDRFNDNAVAVHDAALGWIESLSDDERAFVYLHTIHPHQPYDPPPDLAPPADAGSSIDGSSQTLLDIKHVRRHPTEADQKRIRALYRAALSYNDRELERFLGTVVERYDPSEVLLVITSDHGEELFDHGGVLHGYTLFEEQLDIPLILWSPEHLAPAVVDRPTSNVELSDRLRELATGSSPEELGGSLARPRPHSPFGEPPIRFAAASSVEGGIFMARSDRHKVIWAPRTADKWGSGEGAGRSRSVEYVFDLAADPGEIENLAGTKDLEVAWLRTRLMAWIATETAREEAGELPTLDAEAEARLKALGYLD